MSADILILPVVLAERAKGQTMSQKMKFLEVAEEFLSRRIALELLDRIEQEGISFTSGAHAIEDGHAMRIMRKAKGVTQAGLADMLSCHWVTVSKLENGKIGMSADWRERIHAALCTANKPS